MIKNPRNKTVFEVDIYIIVCKYLKRFIFVKIKMFLKRFLHT